MNTVRRPIVWVVKEQMAGGNVFDYSSAMKYGDIQFITEFDLPLTPRSSLTQEWLRQVAHHLKHSVIGTDYLILTGAPLAMFMLGAIYGRVGEIPKVLVWRREQNEYVTYDPSLISTSEIAP
jgi:hypothetical protein